MSPEEVAPGPCPIPRPHRSRPSRHALLEGKVVVVTAAAGTGIGFATAQRCARGGGDGRDLRHPRAPARRGSADALAEICGKRPGSVPCNVTVEAQVRDLYDAARGRARANRRGREQRRASVATCPSWT